MLAESSLVHVFSIKVVNLFTAFNDLIDNFVKHSLFLALLLFRLSKVFVLFGDYCHIRFKVLAPFFEVDWLLLGLVLAAPFGSWH